MCLAASTKSMALPDENFSSSLMGGRPSFLDNKSLVDLRPLYRFLSNTDKGTGEAANLNTLAPFIFNPLESELNAVIPYLGDYILNAGCGNRDIREIPALTEGKRVVNFDLESEMKGAVIGYLDKIPFGKINSIRLSAMRF